MVILNFFRKTAKNHRRVQALRIVERLSTRATLQDFQTGFYDDFNYLSTVSAIEDALDKGVIRRHDLGCTLEDLKFFYRRHVLDLFEMLDVSFCMENECWPTAERTFYGLNCFTTFVAQNEYAKHLHPDRIDELFEKRINFLFRNERPGSTEEQIKEYIRSAGSVY